MSEYESGAIVDPAFRAETHERPWEGITWPVKGVVVNVIPSNSPQNGQGQLLCDVKLIDDGYTLFNVTVLSSMFHQDTDPEAPLARQTIVARTRNIFDGESFTPQVGSIVLVQFVGPPGANRDAVIVGFFPVSMQSMPHSQRRAEENLFPREVQAVTVFKDGGALTEEEFRARMHPMENEMPRWTRMQNGSAIEIDNRGNINLQSTINREPIEKERYGHYDFNNRLPTKPTPLPEGNAIISTRGARKGNIGLFTGELDIEGDVRQLIIIEDGFERVIDLIVREPVKEQSEEGNVVVQTSKAKQGNIVLRTTDAEHGDVVVETTGAQSGNEVHNIEGTQANAVKKNQINAIEGDQTNNVKGEQSNNVQGDVDINVGGRVNIGASVAMEPAVLGFSLLQWIITVLMTHVHFGVESGNSTTGLPTITPPDMLSEVAFVSRTPGGGASGGSGVPPTPGGSQSEGTSVEQSTENANVALSDIPVNNSNLDKMALAITRFEGFFQGSRSQRNNNPGNLVYRRQAGAIGKDADGFAIFGTLEEGFAALKAQLTLSASGGSSLYNPNMTLVQFFTRYDPTGNAVGYAEYVARSLGVTRDTKIGTILTG